MPGKCDTVLVREVNWIGDAVMTMPALRALRRAMPGSKISLLAKPWVAGIFERDPNVDEMILYGPEHKGFAGKFRISKELRDRCFCLAVLFQNAFDAAAVAFLSRIPERVGYARDGRRLLLTTPVAFDRRAKRMHHIDYYLNLLSKAGITAGEPRPEDAMPWIYLDLGERLRARDGLKGMKRPVLGINPGAAYGSSKRWSAKKFAEVATDFISEFGGSAVIFGNGSEEGEVAGAIAGACDCNTEGRVLSMAGKTTLRELAALLSECDIVLSNDSGPMHIAYATRRPLVAVFGSTDPELTGPPRLGSRVVGSQVQCAPCFERECKEGTLVCMNNINSAEVSAALRELIPGNRAVLFDRDGTLIRDANYLNRWEDFEPLPGLDGIPKLKDKGFKLIGISNQSGVARGIVEESFVNEVNGLLMREHGFDGFYYCPHHPGENCPCRKPEPEMAMRAALAHNIDLRRSFVIGDKDIDMLLAKAVGAKGVLVLTGQGVSSENADFVAKGLTEAIDWIIRADEP